MDSPAYLSSVLASKAGSFLYLLPAREIARLAVRYLLVPIMSPIVSEGVASIIVPVQLDIKQAPADLCLVVCLVILAKLSHLHGWQGLWYAMRTA